LRIESYLYKGGEKKKIFSYIRQFKDVDIQDRLLERFEFQQNIKGLPNRSFWLALKGTPDTEARARLFVDRLNKASFEEREQLRKEMAIVENAGGVVSDDFLDAVARFRKETRPQTTK
jgi:hypothetical protein